MCIRDSSYSPVCYGVFLDCNVAVSWRICREIIFSGKANSWQIGLFCGRYIYTGPTPVSRFGSTSTSLPSQFSRLFPRRFTHHHGLGQVVLNLPDYFQGSRVFLYPRQQVGWKRKFPLCNIRQYQAISGNLFHALFPAFNCWISCLM